MIRPTENSGDSPGQGLAFAHQIQTSMSLQLQVEAIKAATQPQYCTTFLASAMASTSIVLTRFEHALMYVGVVLGSCTGSYTCLKVAEARHHRELGDAWQKNVRLSYRTDTLRDENESPTRKDQAARQTNRGREEKMRVKMLESTD